MRLECRNEKSREQAVLGFDLLSLTCQIEGSRLVPMAIKQQVHQRLGLAWELALEVQQLEVLRMVRNFP